MGEEAGSPRRWLSAAETAVDAVRGADSRAADSQRAGGDISLLQLKAAEGVGHVIWSSGGAQMNREGVISTLEI